MLYKRIMLDESAYIETYVADKADEYTIKAILVIPGGVYGGVCAYGKFPKAFCRG